jgi:LPXTG-motif cell wall-anchored protein
MKKLIISLIVLAFITLPSAVSAEDTVTVCTQYYGGGVVCGAHTPVNTGIADNIPLIGSMLLGSSGVFFFLSKRKKS